VRYCHFDAQAGTTYALLRHALTYTMSARFHAPKTPQERHMTPKRPNEPIAPANIPGQKLDPKIPPDQIPEAEDELLESESERQARESEKALDQARTRIPPG
jgi:hypothetical protein